MSKAMIQMTMTTAATAAILQVMMPSRVLILRPSRGKRSNPTCIYILTNADLGFFFLAWVKTCCLRAVLPLLVPSCECFSFLSYLQTGFYLHTLKLPQSPSPCCAG